MHPKIEEDHVLIAKTELPYFLLNWLLIFKCENANPGGGGGGRKAMLKPPQTNSSR